MTQTNSDCIFCNIVRDEVSADLIYSSDKIVAFNDINPQAPIHILIIPKKHIETINDIGPDAISVLAVNDCSDFLQAHTLDADKNKAETKHSGGQGRNGCFFDRKRRRNKLHDKLRKHIQ